MCPRNSLAEANNAIRERLDLLNNRPFRKLPGTRLSRFLEIDCPALLSLPTSLYQFAQWKKVQAHIDYHVDVEGHFYSVPHRLRGGVLQARYTETTVKCFHNNNRVASHQRSFLKGKHTTLDEHNRLPPFNLFHLRNSRNSEVKRIVLDY